MKLRYILFIVITSITIIYAQTCEDLDRPKYLDTWIFSCEGITYGDYDKVHRYDNQFLKLVERKEFLFNLGIKESYPLQEVYWDENLIYCITSSSWDGPLDIGIFDEGILFAETMKPWAQGAYIQDWFDDKAGLYVFVTGLGYAPYWSGKHVLKFSTSAATYGDFRVTVESYKAIEQCDDEPQIECSCPEGTVFVEPPTPVFGVPSQLPCQVIATPEVYVNRSCTEPD